MRGRRGTTSFQRQADDYAGHGVTTLFAALEVATGQVTDAEVSPPVGRWPAMVYSASTQSSPRIDFQTALS